MSEVSEKVALIRTAKARPCADCGNNFPYWVMQLDHRGGAQKCFSLRDASSSAGRGETKFRKEITITMVETELAKCDPVCANCHAGRTHARTKNHLSNKCGCAK
jgi:hypothetical protein